MEIYREKIYQNKDLQELRYTRIRIYKNKDLPE